MRNTFGLNRSLGGSIAVIAIVSVLSTWVIWTTLRQLDAATEARGRSNSTMLKVDAFFIAMLDQETGLRGYLITGRKSSLEPYASGRSDLDQAIAALRNLIAANVDQMARLAAAETAARAWQTEVGEPAVGGMGDPATKPQAVTLESAGPGKRHFDEFRERLDAIRDLELKALKEQNATLAHAKRDASIALCIGALTTLLICGFVAVAINRQIVLPLEHLSDAMGRLAQRDLEAVVPGIRQRNEVGAMARAVDVFRNGLIELDRTSLLRATADTLPAMVGYVDAQRRVGFLNGEFESWFDLPTGDVSKIVGRPLSEVFAKDPFPGAELELEAALSGTETRSEHRLARRGAGRRDVEAFLPAPSRPWRPRFGRRDAIDRHHRSKASGTPPGFAGPNPPALE